MIIGLLGNKIGMTQIFDETGNIIPVTILKVGPCIVTEVKTTEKNGYNSIQVGYGDVSSKSLTEFRMNKESEFKIGQVLNVDAFEPGQLINIQGKTIGKGFSGLQKRHNFTRGPMTHGSKNHRAPGSIGMGTTPGRVLPGKKMAGQLGNKIITIKNLKVIQINSEENILVIKGSVPGKPGNLLSIVCSEQNN